MRVVRVSWYHCSLAWIKGYQKQNRGSFLLSSRMFFQSKISIKGLAVRHRHSRGRSVVRKEFRCLCVWLRLRASFSMHSSSLSSSLHHFPGGDDFEGCRIRSKDGQTHSRASPGQLNVLD